MSARTGRLGFGPASTKSKAAGAVIACASLLLAGCGGSASSATPPPETMAAASSSAAVPLAGLTTLAVMLAALWLFVIGLAIFMLGLPPGTEEVLRGFAFLIAAIAYGGVWLGLAMLFSVQFRSAATAALASLAVWLLFAFFWSMVITVITPIIAPVDPYNPMSVLYTVEVGQALSRLSPNTLFAETTMAFLNPGTRSLGLVLNSQMQGAISGPLPFSESVALVWPQVTGLLASVIGLFTVAYVMFQRQEVRA